MQKKKSVFLETQFELRHIVSLSLPPPFLFLHIFEYPLSGGPVFRSVPFQGEELHLH